jgi:PDZ domain-containing secreted protein
MRSNLDHGKLMALILFAFAFPALSQAQRTDESVRVKVHKTQEGHTLQIEEDVPASDAQDLEQLMKKYGMTDELQQLKPGEEVEIVIRRKQGGEDVQDVTIEVDRKPTPAPAQPTAPAVAKPIETPKQAFLGVHYEMEYGSTSGSHITKVEPGTPAFRAGLKAGDVITKADEIDLRNLDDLSNIISRKKAGDRVKITFVRDGKQNTTYVTLAERDESFFLNNPSGGPSYQLDQRYEISPNGKIWIDEEHSKVIEPDLGDPLLGVLMIQSEKKIVTNGIESTVKSEGAIVDDVIGNSAATEVGLHAGDKILVINGKHIKSAAEVTDLVAAMKVGDRVDVEYLRGGQRGTGTGTLKSRKNFDLPSDEQLKRQVELMGMTPTNTDPGMFDRVHRMMDEALARANGTATVREFRMVIKMDELSPAEAQTLSAKTGQPIKAVSDLDVRGLTLSPNPSTGRFQMGFELPMKGTTTIEVMDMNGTVVYNEQLHDFQGRYNRDFDISQEAKGIYVMRIVQNGRAFTRKIITQ